MANRYWVGGSSTWNTTAGTKWSTTSGGGGGSAVPTSSDDVFFDASSGSGTVNTSGTTDINCRSLNFTGFTGTFNHVANDHVNIGDSTSGASDIILKLSATMTYDGDNEAKFVFKSSSATPQKIITSGVNVITPIELNANDGNYILDDAFTGYNIQFVGDDITFDTNNHNITIGNFAFNSTNPVINMGSSIWTLTGTGIVWNDTGTSTINASTSTIVISDTTSTSKTFFLPFSPAKTYNNLTVSGDNVIINRSCTFNTLAINTAGLTDGLKLTSGTTTTVTSLTTNGSLGNLAKLQSTSAGSAATISKSSGTVNVEYMSIKDSTATGGATFRAANSTNVSGNTGWLFIDIYNEEITFVGTSGFSSTFTTVTYLEETLSGTSDMSADFYTVFHLEVVLSGTSGLTVSYTVVNPISEVEKKFAYKVYDLDGNFIGQWDDVVSDFTYSQEINSAGSSIDVVLARNSDTLQPDLENLLDQSDDEITTQNSLPINVILQLPDSVGPASNVVLNYDVDIYIYYGSYGQLATEDSNELTTEDGITLLGQQGTPDGSLIFQGYISKYTSKYGGDEKTTVTLSSYGAELDNYMIESAGSTTVAFNSYDPSVILTEIIDQYESDGGVVSYDATTIDNTETVVSYTFNTSTTLEGVKKSLELAPSDWFWYLDMKQNLIHFHNRPTSPDHYFVLGKHIHELDVEQYIDDITNVIYFSGGDTGGGENLYVKYTDPTSEALYRRGMKKYSDNRVTLQESADIIANSELERNSTPRYRSTVSIVDKVYDIENIKLGDLVAFRNFGNYVDALTMQIVAIDYNPERVQLQLDTLLPRVSKRLEDIKRNLDKQETQANPATPDT